MKKQGMKHLSSPAVAQNGIYQVIVGGATSLIISRLYLSAFRSHSIHIRPLSVQVFWFVRAPCGRTNAHGRRTDSARMRTDGARTSMSMRCPPSVCPHCPSAFRPHPSVVRPGFWT